MVCLLYCSKCLPGSSLAGTPALPSLCRMEYPAIMYNEEYPVIMYIIYLLYNEVYPAIIYMCRMLVLCIVMGITCVYRYLVAIHQKSVYIM